MNILIQSLFFILLFLSATAAYCGGKPGPPKVNSQPIWAGTPRFINKTKYGKLFEIGQQTTTMKLLHVYGNSYQMGLAHGTLLKKQINVFINQFWNYAVDQMKDNIKDKVPKMFAGMVADKFLKLALDLTYYATKYYTNKRYYQQIKGISDASGISFAMLRRLHMIGELQKATCSMFGAWGNATLNGETIQLRSLDWRIDGPFRKYPLVVVYHPNSAKDGNLWMNIGFVGWVGVLSGISEQQMAVSEIGVYFSDQTFGKTSRIGNPFTFILRDVLQFDRTLNDTIVRFKNARRTCNLILGVGDGKAGYFRGFQYGHSVLNVVNDSDPLPHNSSWHYAIENIVYWGMDWLCPSYNQRLGSLLKSSYGKISAEETIRVITPGLNSGNLQAVVYDLTNQSVYFAYGQVIGNKKVNAYERPYIRLQLKDIFNEKQ